MFCAFIFAVLLPKYCFPTGATLQHLRTCTSKTAKITKGDIARITLTVCQCAAE